jgi:hypothetical protein
MTGVLIMTLIIMPTGIPFTVGSRVRVVSPLSIEDCNSSLAYKFGKCKWRVLLIIFISAFAGAGEDPVAFEGCFLTRRLGGTEKNAENAF